MRYLQITNPILLKKNDDAKYSASSLYNISAYLYSAFAGS